MSCAMSTGTALVHDALPLLLLPPSPPSPPPATPPKQCFPWCYNKPGEGIPWERLCRWESCGACIECSVPRDPPWCLVRATPERCAADPYVRQVCWVLCCRRWHRRRRTPSTVPISTTWRANARISTSLTTARSPAPCSRRLFLRRPLRRRHPLWKRSGASSTARRTCARCTGT